MRKLCRFVALCSFVALIGIAGSLELDRLALAEATKLSIVTLIVLFASAKIGGLFE